MPHLTPADPCRALLIYPRFSAATFWNFSVACELVGARYPAAPLGLITLAPTLPPNWDIRLVNRNTEELTGADLAWADLVILMAFYLHLGPFARRVMATIDAKLAELEDAAAATAPAAQTAASHAHPAQAASLLHAWQEQETDSPAP